MLNILCNLYVLSINSMSIGSDMKKRANTVFRFFCDFGNGLEDENNVCLLLNLCEIVLFKYFQIVNTPFKHVTLHNLSSFSLVPFVVNPAVLRKV